ncbi:MAG: hypothetical protein N4A33_07350 [Bacteriovoracaceae bacterium]|jgi:23S rRNA (uracil1939-C5)-methyltransferase|nr:hypothetical protein [Bacteriovoracaceae bacterium]
MTQIGKKINFLIDHIDPLGQGVFKQQSDIYFIPKTLPGESGIAIVYRSKKNIHFAYVDKINQESSYRIKPDCLHFEKCNGCQFLHTDYNTEINLKEITFQRMLYQVKHKAFETIKAPKRTNYRNRIQLHYNKNKSQIGFINPRTKQISSSTYCLMPNERLQENYDKLIQSWQKEAPKNPNKGHVEIYEKENRVIKTWNSKYATGGFSQVFDHMNTKLNNIVSHHLDFHLDTIDLFGGKGNLSQAIDSHKKVIIDYYTHKTNDNQFHIDLYQDHALKEFRKMSSQKFEQFIVDPPRKGFSQLTQWAQFYQPKRIIYVSCHPATMIRDIKNLIGYSVDQAYLLDLFPSTYHFEALLVLNKTKA